jgi:hypothetical protein
VADKLGNFMRTLAMSLPACAASIALRTTRQMQHTTPEVRPDAGRPTRFSTSAVCRAHCTRSAVAQYARRDDPISQRPEIRGR